MTNIEKKKLKNNYQFLKFAGTSKKVHHFLMRLLECNLLPFPKAEKRERARAREREREKKKFYTTCLFISTAISTNKFIQELKLRCSTMTMQGLR